MGLYIVIYGIVLLFVVEGALVTILKQSKNRRKGYGLAENFLFWMGVLYIPILVHGFLKMTN